MGRKPVKGIIKKLIGEMATGPDLRESSAKKILAEFIKRWEGVDPQQRGFFDEEIPKDNFISD